jgi:dTDP-4-amino-4,6-dideoxygalactose transaminase
MYRHGKEEIENVGRIVASGSWFRYYGSGSHCHAVETFEEKMSKYSGAKHILATSSCTGALISSLAAMGVGPKDEVIVPAYTFIATAAAVIAVGAVPVIAEIDETLTIDINDIRRKISPRTKAVVVVHMLGYPCNMDEIIKLAAEKKIMVLEDAAQSVGASYKGKTLGAIGDMGCCSLQWHKIISSGEGGCVLTNNESLYERAAIYHDDAHCFRGIDKGIPSFPGVNYRMSEIAGALACVQMDRLPGILADLRNVKKKIIASLVNIAPFKVAPSYDSDGDAGTTMTILAPSMVAAGSFKEKTGASSIFSNQGTNWHYYYHWDYILEKRSASGSGFPWKLGDWESPVKYSKDMCPATLDILSRSFNFGINPSASDSDVKAVADKILNGIKP